MSLVLESPERTAKCTRDADYDHNTNTIDPYGEDHPAKHTCVTPLKNYTTNEGNLVTSKSLASRIEKGSLWEENNDTVSLGSQTYEIEEQNGNIFDAIDFMSVDNLLFADNGIRCTVLSHECDYSTNLLSVSKPWIIALNCRMKIYCSVTHVLKNAHIQICIHGLTFFACQNYKRTRQLPVEVTPF